VSASIPKKHRTIKFTSSPQTWQSGGSAKMDFEGFVEQQADGGARTIIDAFVVHASLSLTVGTATTFGEDLARFVDSLTLYQKDGVQRYVAVPGDAIRILNWATRSPGSIYDMPDFSVGGPTTVNLSLYVPLRKEYCENPEAFSLPADHWSHITLKTPGATAMSLGTSVCTINSGSYYVEAICHASRLAFDYCVDTVSAVDFKSTLETDLVVSGRVHDLLIYTPGAHGGLKLTGVTEVNVVDEFPQSTLVFPDLVRDYQVERGEATNLGTSTGDRIRSNPFVPAAADSGVPRAIAALLSTGNANDEGKVRDKLRVKTTQTSSPGTLRAIVRTIEPRSDKAEQVTGAKYLRNPHAAGQPVLPATHGGVRRPVRGADSKYMMRTRHG